MARFHGPVGFGLTVEVSPGVWEDQITEYTYFGDLVRNSLRTQETQNVNDDLSVGHSVSIVSNAFSEEHIFAIRYVKWRGAYWKVIHQEIQRPRIILRLGGVYNGPKGPSSGSP